jgi:hypothetical protein
MRTVRISALLLLGITAAYEQAVRTQVTYNSNIKCSQSFCDAFFKDESICEFSGTHTLIYERDGECGIEIKDAEVTCSVQCHEAVVITDEMKRGGVKRASEESMIYTSSLTTDIAVALLAIWVVLCVVCQWWLWRARLVAENKTTGPMLARALGTRLHKEEETETPNTIAPAGEISPS